MNAGASVISGASTERKISTSSTMMNSTEASSTSLPSLPDCALMSTCCAIGPVRCACRPAGQAGRGDRRAHVLDQGGHAVPVGLVDLGQGLQLLGRTVRRTPLVLARTCTFGTACNAVARFAMAVASASSSCPLERLTTTPTGVSLDRWNGAANVCACVLGALAGRKSELSVCVTLDSEGRNAAHATAPASHTTSTSQRNRTANLPIPVKTACT